MLREEMSVSIRTAESKDVIDRLVLSYFLKHLGENIYEKYEDKKTNTSEPKENQEHNK